MACCSGPSAGVRGTQQPSTLTGAGTQDFFVGTTEVSKCSSSWQGNLCTGSCCNTLLMFNTIALSCLCVNLPVLPLSERVPTALLLAAAISNLKLPLCNVTDHP